MLRVRFFFARNLRRIERFLTSRTIPVRSFGWEAIGHRIDGFGVASEMGKWHFTENERAPFSRHNRSLSNAAIAIRKLACRVEKI